MAFSFGLGESLDTARYNGRTTSADESVPQYTADSRTTNSRFPASLHRRFTTSGPTLSTIGISPIGQQRRHAMMNPSADLPFSIHREAQLLERKQAEYDFIRKKRAQFQEEMSALEQEEQRLRDDLGFGAGNQSEPTTPPEHATSGIHNGLPRSNRFSTSSILSPMGFTSRQRRAGSQTTSPPSERDRAYDALHGFPSHSVPESRRDSDDEENGRYEKESTNQDRRKASSLNRNSMPVTGRDRSFADISSPTGHVNNSQFSFDEDNRQSRRLESSRTSKPQSMSLYMHTDQEDFPILVRQGGNGEPQSAVDVPGSLRSSIASSAGWPNFTNTMSNRQSFSFSRPPPSTSGSATPTKASGNNRHSMGASIGASESKRSSLQISSPEGVAPTRSGAVPKLQPSFSTSSVPTMNSIEKSNGASSQIQAAPISAEARLHRHNMSLGRIPPSANTGNYQEASGETSYEQQAEENRSSSNVQSMQSGLHASAPSFGPTNGSAVTNGAQSSSTATIGSFDTNNVANPTWYGQQTQPAMNGLTNTMAQFQINGQNEWNGNLQATPQNYMNYYSMGQAGSRAMDPMRANPAKRPQTADTMSTMPQSDRSTSYGLTDNGRFTNIRLEDIKGQILLLAKDQHGCRYLQKKLEDKSEDSVRLIFNETYEYMVDLMTDPFGNYLVQKLLEHANEDQTTQMVQNAAPEMVTIALNQHGTRALQKMIERLTTTPQVTTIIHALKDYVVQMIQDLNGNHVIQKCLNKWSIPNFQFIFDSVADHVVDVATHRHGCCVIQRCIDHASMDQKLQLVNAVTSCAWSLVEDPFGNYVLQYVFDMGEDEWSSRLAQLFVGHVGVLSKGKFGSNVVEKAIRMAPNPLRREIIMELLEAPDFVPMADDPYANYVVQTAWEYIEPKDEPMLAEMIRPIVPRVRGKPHGRRYTTKLADYDKRHNIDMGPMSPGDINSPPALTNSEFSPNSQNGNIFNRPTPYRTTGRGYGGYRNRNGFQGNPNTFGSPPGYAYATNDYGSPYGATNLNNAGYGRFNQTILPMNPFAASQNAQQSYDPFQGANGGNGNFF